MSEGVNSHQRHSEEVEFDLRCDDCRARVSRRMRAELRTMLLDKGLTEGQADEFFERMDQIIVEDAYPDRSEP